MDGLRGLSLKDGSHLPSQVGMRLENTIQTEATYQVRVYASAALTAASKGDFIHSMLDSQVKTLQAFTKRSGRPATLQRLTRSQPSHPDITA